MPTKIYVEVLQQLPFWTFSGMATPPLHWTACSSACQYLSEENFPHIQHKPSLVWHKAILSWPIKTFLGDLTSLQPSSRLCRENAIQHCQSIYSGFSALSPQWWWLLQRAALHPEGLFGKQLGKNAVDIFLNQTEQTNSFSSCIKSFMWHLLSSCSELVLWRTDLCFHWGKTVKSLESCAQGCNTVWQLKSLETAFSFTAEIFWGPWFFKVNAVLFYSNFFFHIQRFNIIFKISPCPISCKRYDWIKGNQMKKDIMF